MLYLIEYMFFKPIVHCDRERQGGEGEGDGGDSESFNHTQIATFHDLFILLNPLEQNFHDIDPQNYIML